MEEKKKKYQNEEGIVEGSLVNEDFSNSNKKGKTISMKSALIAAGGILAGRASKGFQAESNAESVQASGAEELIADSVFTDENADGIYELGQSPSPVVVEEINDNVPQGQSFNVATAPHASSSSDDMSFSDAFAAAREEVGPGGVFMWHGNAYNTFYAEEVDDHGNPVIDYETVEPGSQNFDDYEQSTQATSQSTGDSYSDNSGDEVESQVNVMGVDADFDGSVETYLVDTNLDGSADAIYVDANVDGQITNDEVQIIHDPATLEAVESPASGAEISVDTNADGQDDAVFGDADGDLVADVVGVDSNQNQVIDENEIQVLNQDALQEGGYEDAVETESGEVNYEGEVSNDMPEDVPDSELENYTGEVSKLEDNFPDYNEWV